MMQPNNPQHQDTQKNDTQKTSLFTLAQISDCHLFADINKQHHGANVYQHLVEVIADLKIKKPDILIFTGDLTQDHTEQSYQHFANVFKAFAAQVPCYYLPGNHDDVALLDKYLPKAGFYKDKSLSKNRWHITLLNSKSATPAGFFNQSEFEQLTASCAESTPNYNAHSDTYLDTDLATEPANNSEANNSEANNSSINSDTHSKSTSAAKQFVFMHHHPIDVGYFIDRHGLYNQADFWQQMNNSPAIKGIACGHVHRAMELMPESTGYSKPLYTCPATSIQFDPTADTVKALNKKPAYRLYTFHDDGKIDSEVIEVNRK